MIVRGVLAVVAAAAVLSSCSTGETTWTGAVTTLAPRLCVGRAEAAGDCFDASPSAMSALHVGECIEVTFVAGSGNGGSVPRHLLRLRPVPSGSDPRDCPA